MRKLKYVYSKLIMVDGATWWIKFFLTTAFSELNGGR